MGTLEEQLAALERDRLHYVDYYTRRVASLEERIRKYQGTGRGRYLASLKVQLAKAQRNLEIYQRRKGVTP